MSPRAAGGCLCGAVRYQVNGPLRDVIFCHCTRCRRTHGHFAAYTACARDDLELVEQRSLRWYESDERRRGFCNECGASLFWERAGRPTISISAGTLDEPTGLSPGEHIFVADAGDYYERPPSQ
ncbi:MAG: GFA family protein [Actinobacteria bacterium]|nr:GFA family protein [Actinomycetota bacterium]